MISRKTNSILCFVSLIFVFLILFALIKNEEPERDFYSTGGVVIFAQYILLTGSLSGVAFACRGAWLNLVKYESWRDIVLIAVVSFPLLLLSTLLFYTSLVLLAAT